MMRKPRGHDAEARSDRIVSPENRPRTVVNGHAISSFEHLDILPPGGRADLDPAAKEELPFY